MTAPQLMAKMFETIIKAILAAVFTVICFLAWGFYLLVNLVRT